MTDAESFESKTAPHSDNLIASAISALGAGRPFPEEFWNLVVGIVEKNQGKAASLGAKIMADSHDVASGFLVYLAAAAPVVRTSINSLSTLARALRKWAVETGDPQGKELWQAIGEALLRLEKEGVVQRPEAYRAYRNGNETPWHLAEYGGKMVSPPDAAELAGRLPRVAAKKESDRVLKPDEARRMVHALLELVKGTLTMREIVAALKPHVPLLHVLPAVGMGGDTADDEDERPSCDPPDHGLNASHELSIAGEVSFAVEAIWSAAGELARGTTVKVYGRELLCCYWIPDRVAGRCDKRLDDFGPTSTVDNVVADLTAIMAANVPTTDASGGESAVQACRCVIGGIIDELSRLCSENGYCRAFYEEWNPQG